MYSAQKKTSDVCHRVKGKTNQNWGILAPVWTQHRLALLYAFARGRIALLLICRKQASSMHCGLIMTYSSASEDVFCIKTPSDMFHIWGGKINENWASCSCTGNTASITAWHFVLARGQMLMSQPLNSTLSSPVTCSMADLHYCMVLAGGLVPLPLISTQSCSSTVAWWLFVQVHQRLCFVCVLTWEWLQNQSVLCYLQPQCKRRHALPKNSPAVALWLGDGDVFKCRGGVLHKFKK